MLEITKNVIFVVMKFNYVTNRTESDKLNHQNSTFLNNNVYCRRLFIRMKSLIR